MKTIGLTGGIASGKSVVSQCMSELGAYVIYADKVGHEVYNPGTSAFHLIVDYFGSDIVSVDGTIDRRKLGGIVFNDKEALDALNRITHPRMYDKIKADIGEIKKKGASPAIVLEAAILIEANWFSLVDEVWVVITTVENAIERIMTRNGLSENEARARIASQLSSEERTRYGDVVIHNDGTIDDLRCHINELWKRKLSSK
ncbi:MAG: dephospho-CoA kinase [Thermodesulfobacteriota bacterium]|nr:dephospho-CoA kinase [Thermodesulfobacteriota bacterium]